MGLVATLEDQLEALYQCVGLELIEPAPDLRAFLGLLFAVLGGPSWAAVLGLLRKSSRGSGIVAHDRRHYIVKRTEEWRQQRSSQMWRVNSGWWSTNTFLETAERLHSQQRSCGSLIILTKCSSGSPILTGRSWDERIACCNQLADRSILTACRTVQEVWTDGDSSCAAQYNPCEHCFTV